MRRVISTKVGLLAATALLLLSVMLGTIPFAHSTSGAAAAPSGQSALKAAANPARSTITFTSAGLPDNQIWSVFLLEWGYSLANNTPATIVFNVNATDNGTAANDSGNYTFSINPVPGYDVVSITGTPLLCGSSATTNYCNVTTADADVVVTFHAAPQYTVTFNETGLTGGTWSVTFGDSTLSGAAGANISFGTANGTYPFSIGGGNQGTTFGTNVATPSSGNVTVAGDTIQNITFTANPPPVSFAVTYPTGAFSTNNLPYFALPYNVTWTVNEVANASLAWNTTTQTLSFIWLTSGCGPFTFPCNTIWSTNVPYNYSVQAGATATSATFVFPVNYANLTASTYLGFDLPEGQWQITVNTVVANLVTGAVGTGSTVQAAFIALTAPSGTITAPSASTSLTSGSLVTVTGSYSGYFIVSANVTITNTATGALVLTASVYAPAVTLNPFSVPWHAQTAGTYNIVLDLVAAWRLPTIVNETVNVTAGIPVTYINGTGVNILGIGAGGSAAILVTIGVIIGMIVMALVGRSVMGGNKPAPAAQPWSPTQTSSPTGTGSTSGGTGGSTGDSSDATSGGTGGSSPPS